MIEVARYSPFQHQLTTMHDNTGMSASHGARMSPGSSLQTLQPVPHEIHTSVIKKIDHSVESIVPSLRSGQTTYGVNISETGGNVVNVGFNERPDDGSLLDDDFSDHDSHYSEDLEDIDEDLQPIPRPNVTKQLLDFADMVSGDIQKFFGRKKGEEDSCDIYEDKWVATKSGRELYYADLMKIVQGEDKAGGKSKQKASPLLDISNSVKDPQSDNRNTFTGKLDKKIGVGPLNELFEYGLRQFLADKKLKNKEVKRLKSDVKRFDSVTPMQNRKLPTSFWREPGSQPHQSHHQQQQQQQQQQQCQQQQQQQPNSAIQTNNPPDFSDLLESWRLDRNEFSGELSSSEVSMSPESV